MSAPAKTTAADGKTEVHHLPGVGLVVSAVEFNALYAAREQDRARAAAPQAAVGVSDEQIGEAYQLIDRFLRNNLDDADYETFSDALSVLYATKPEAPAPMFGDEDHVLVPRGLIGAACSAIEKKREGRKVLAELRRYTVGDLSAALAAPAQGAAVPDAERYRALRSSVGNPVYCARSTEHGVSIIHGEALDKAADALRAARQPKP